MIGNGNQPTHRESKRHCYDRRRIVGKNRRLVAKNAAGVASSKQIGQQNCLALRDRVPISATGNSADYVVTEFGVAPVGSRALEQTARSLIAFASPEEQSELDRIWRAIKVTFQAWRSTGHRTSRRCHHGFRLLPLRECASPASHS